MKMLMSVSLLLLLWAISCNRDKDKDISGMTIVGGSACGWCAGADSVILNEYSINYRYMQSCDHHATSKVFHMEKSVWDNLTGLIDLDVFNSIRLNTSNVSFDGCDQWITIRNGSYSHTIRFGYQDSASLQRIRPLVDKLDSLREEYRKGSVK
jgi:hypothetical protein